jgi:hypothetical protein
MIKNKFPIEVKQFVFDEYTPSLTQIIQLSMGKVTKIHQIYNNVHH